MNISQKIDWPYREFKIWQYTVGMKRLLLRSTKNQTFDTRIDVYFQNVLAICMPTFMSGLRIEVAGNSVIDRASREMNLSVDQDVVFFEIAGVGYSGYVVAGLVTSCEDHYEYDEPSSLW